MLSKTLEKWLNEHQPDGFGNGSIGETALWYFVNAIKEGKEDINERGKEIISAIDTDYNIRSRLKTVITDIKITNSNIITELEKPTVFDGNEPTVNMIEHLRELQRDKRLLEYLLQ